MTMIYYQNTTDYHLEDPSAVTLGKFDGVHLGHQKLISSILRQEQQGLTSVCFTLNSRCGERILTPSEQRDTVEALGVSVMINCPFVPEISRMTPLEFARQVLAGRLNARYLAVGTDFRFGYRRAGDAAFLRQFGKENGIRVDVIPKLRYKDREISSTYVREALERGEMELARKLLGRPFPITGQVVHGRELGRKLGVPTVNLLPPPEKILPPYGVYVSRVTEKEAYGSGTGWKGRNWYGITNVGCKPTVDGSFRGVETCLFDDEPQLYGAWLQVELLHYVRPERKFASLEELKAQIQQDIAAGRSYLRE